MEETKNHTIWNHEERFYKVLEHLKKQLDSGAINQEEYDIMREKAIADESDLRRKDIEYITALFGTRNAKEEDVVYYQQRISAYIDELYISCKYSWDNVENIRNNIDYLVDNTHYNSLQFRNMCKRIYNDIISNKIDITNITGEELLKMYED